MTVPSAAAPASMARFHGISLDARDPVLLGRFWSALLEWPAAEVRGDASASPPQAVVLTAPGPASYHFTLRRADTPKFGQNRIHLDLPSRSRAHQDQLVQTALTLDGHYCDVGQAGDEGHVVLADPEGNELCIIEPGNRFLADTAAIGAINCEGSRALGHFWSTMLGWPLVWDRDDETAIQSPYGGTKITWSGPPLPHHPPRDRFHLEVAIPQHAPASATSQWREAGAHHDGQATWRDVDQNRYYVVN